MKRLRLFGVAMIVLMCLTSALVFAQDATQEPTAEATPLPIPTVPLMPCPADVTASTVCDMIATKAEDIVGVWSVYFNSKPAFIRYNADGTWLIADSVEHTNAVSVEGHPYGTFSFDKDGIFTSSDPNTPESIMSAECRAGHYLLRVIKVGDQPVALNKALVDDCFVPRRTDWAYTLLWAGSE